MNRATLRRRVACFASALIALAALCIEPAAAQSIATETAPVAEYGPLSVGLYAGELYKADYLAVLYRPQDLELTPSYLVAANIDYRFYQFAHIPMQFEAEFDLAKRFHDANEFDIVLAPLVRWTSFPWNRLLYTTAAVSALGLSYATGVSAWEREHSGTDHGSNLLQFGAYEVTFAASEHTRNEVFFRVHHRSGVYGLINGVSGGSSYLAFGFRHYL
jgi:hypothetical protein